MILTHYGSEPLTLDRERTYDQSEFGNGKPRGLWLSDDSDFGWAEWCQGEEWNLGALTHTTRFTLAPDANILHLDSLAAIKSFTGEYGGHPAYPGDLGSHWINWPLMAERYDGILITPYQWNARLDTDTMWYYGWDCASACIWNLDALVPVIELDGLVEHLTAGRPNRD